MSGSTVYILAMGMTNESLHLLLLVGVIETKHESYNEWNTVSYFLFTKNARETVVSSESDVCGYSRDETQIIQ